MTYREGTLVVLVWDAESGHIAWQGTATGVVPEKPSKLESKIDKAIIKMFKKWDKMVAAKP